MRRPLDDKGGKPSVLPAVLDGLHLEGCLVSLDALNLAVLRRIALDLLRADTTRKASLKGRRKTAAWDDTYMARLLRG